MQVAAVLAVLMGLVVALGRLLHYSDPRAYAAFVLLVGPVGAAAWLLASAAAREDPASDLAVRTCVAVFALVVLAGFALGSVGWLSRRGYFTYGLVALAASAFAPRRAHAGRTSQPSDVPAALVGAAGALLAFAVAFAVTHAPLTLYDSVSYHLHFAARWLQDRRLSIVPTPFSDEAQAYAPADGELFFAWLMAPFHGDFIARVGQLPFALATGAALYALARRIGAKAAHAVYPAVFFLLSRPILEQAVGANVDLVCAAMFVAAVYFGVLAVDRNDARDWLWFGVGAGLYLGSKYLALVYAPILLLLALVRRPTARMLWALPGILVFGAPWYLRNWIVAGSPIYPASLQVAGITIARGAFTRAAMLNTIFHTDDLRLAPVMAAHAFGPTSFVFAVPFAIAGAVGMARRGWWPGGVLVAVPVLMAPLYWFGLPINIDSRFFMPAVGLALLPLAFVFSDRRPRWNAVVHALYAVGAVWILVGIKASIPYTTPWFMRGWLAMDGLLPSRFLAWFVALAILISVAWWAGSRRPGWALPAAMAVCAASAAGLAFGGERWCPGRCDYLQVTSPYIRPNYLYAWSWIDDHLHGATIAYTGINLPYPLTGEQLTNRVVYANIDGHANWRFHDYDREYRTGRFLPPMTPLATSSGELMPVAARSGARDDAARPRYERMLGYRDGWIDNLERLRVNYLFVAALSAYEIDYVWHNAGGFPVEDDWARADPARFELVYENPQVHIYAVRAAVKRSA